MSIGHPYLPATVSLSAVLEVADRTKLEQNLQQGVSWDLTAAPGEIMTYVLSWEELWQPARVNVTFAGQDVRQVNVTYRTGIRSNIISSNLQLCDGSQGMAAPSTLEAVEAAPEIPQLETINPSITKPLFTEQTQNAGSPPVVRDLGAGEWMYVSSGSVLMNGVFCGNEAGQVCVLIYEATYPQRVEVEFIDEGHTYLARTTVLGYQQLVDAHSPHYWTPANCSESGCAKATILYFRDGNVVGEPVILTRPTQ